MKNIRMKITKLNKIITPEYINSYFKPIRTLNYNIFYDYLFYFFIILVIIFIYLAFNSY
jgi:hypothetical protein